MKSSLKTLINKNAKFKNISELDSHIQITGLMMHCELSLEEISHILLLLNSDTISKLIQKFRQYLRVGFIKEDIIQQAIVNNLPELPQSPSRIKMFDYADDAWHGVRILQQAAEISSYIESTKCLK